MRRTNGLSTGGYRSENEHVNVERAPSVEIDEKRIAVELTETRRRPVEKTLAYAAIGLQRGPRWFADLIYLLSLWKCNVRLFTRCAASPVPFEMPDDVRVSRKRTSFFRFRHADRCAESQSGDENQAQGDLNGAAHRLSPGG
jgi:hypothetical protein